MNDQRRPDSAADSSAERRERPIVPTDIDPAGSARGVDDHFVPPYPRGIGNQPTSGLDQGAGREHLASPSQGVKVEDAPDPGRDAPAGGEAEANQGPLG